MTDPDDTQPIVTTSVPAIVSVPLHVQPYRIEIGLTIYKTECQLVEILVPKEPYGEIVFKRGMDDND